MVLQSYDMEVGAGTNHPATFLRAIGPEPWNAAYVQASRRPTDGRYGDNPNRLQHYYQFQVILKPSPPDSQELYLGSLEAIGIDPLAHDIRFVEDDWESPTLGAWGLGWEVWCDGMDITQFSFYGVPDVDQKHHDRNYHRYAIHDRYGFEISRDRNLKQMVSSNMGVNHNQRPEPNQRQCMAIQGAICGPGNDVICCCKTHGRQEQSKNIVAVKP